MRIVVLVLAMLAVLASGMAKAGADWAAQATLGDVFDPSGDPPADPPGSDPHKAAPQADECYTCAHVVVPLPAAHAIRIPANIRWKIADEAWVAVTPQAETPPPRKLGNEDQQDTSLPIIEVNHVSLCTDRVRDSSRCVERAG
ncbi:MAG: hypothetical protein AB1698_08860 [Pseudomonadota bacterium]|nr:hypothetical protein [Hyphomicrobiales bacterium]